MFKKLRIKFIAITMVMVTIVMALAFTVVCIVEYQRSYSVVQTALESAVQQGYNDSIMRRDRFMNSSGTTPEGLRNNQASDPSRLPAPSSPSDSHGSPSSPASTSTRVSSASSQKKIKPSSGDSQDSERSASAASLADAPSDAGAEAEADAQSPSASAPDAAPYSDSESFIPRDNPDESPDYAESAESTESPGPTQSAEVMQSTDSTEMPDSSETLDSTEMPDSSDTLDASEPSNSEAESDEDSERMAPPSIGNRPGQQRTSSSIIPVAVYHAEDNGTLRVVPSITTASISSDVLEDATDYVNQSDNGFNTLPTMGLHYYKSEKNGETYIAFADTSYTDSWKTLALMLALVGFGTLVVFFIISLFYSRWALAPVREAWDSQKQFVADASHDLKTPLTVILANASILLKHPDHTIANESQWVESTQKEAEEMQGLVNEMLELAQVEAGERIEPIRDPIDLSDLVDGETLLFDSVALERGYLFECSIEQNVHILGDEKQVRKMVSTLIENAFKYVNEGGTVGVTLRKSGKNATLAIRNTGSTISEADLPHIFDRFYRTDKARTSGTGGFGLGLAIARGTAQQHGGDITCSSSDGEGTTFTVKLPVSDN